MVRIAPASAVLCLGAVAAQVPVPPLPREPFVKVRLTEEFYAEGSAVGDVDRDGRVDFVAGPFWWRGPQFVERHEIYPPRSYPIDAYSDTFLDYCHDIDGDGWIDVVRVGFPGADASWYQNPGRPGVHWRNHAIWSSVGAESPALTDLDGDGRPDLVCVSQGLIAWLTPDPVDPTRQWLPHLVSPVPGWNVFTHGLGVGDLNGDGRQDIVTRIGWFEQPPSLLGDPPWPPHAFEFGAGQGGAQMLVYDVDGDGDRDVVTSINAHAYGLSWFEQIASAGQITFREHVIQQPFRDLSDPDQFSQPHALALADMDGDGLADFITGKRFWAHNGGDPGARDPAVLYWFGLIRQGGTRFVPHRVDIDSGVGLQVVAADLDGDGRTDLAVSNKKGTALFLRSD